MSKAKYFAIALSILTVFLPSAGLAQEIPGEGSPSAAVGQILVVQGAAFVDQAGRNLPAQPDMYLFVGNELRTGPSGRIVVSFFEGDFDTVTENAHLKVVRTQAADQTWAIQLLPVTAAATMAAAGEGTQEMHGGTKAGETAWGQAPGDAGTTEEPAEQRTTTPSSESAVIIREVPPPPPAAGDALGEIEDVTGEAFVDRYASSLPAEAGMLIYVNDEVRTGDGARVMVKFSDGAFVTIGGLSRLSVEEYLVSNGNGEETEGITRFWFPLGRMRINLGKNTTQIKTPTALLSTESVEFGGDLIVTHEGVDTEVYVLARKIYVLNRERADEEPVLVRSCQFSTIRRDMKPTPPMALTMGKLAALFADASEIQDVAGGAAGLCVRSYVSPWKPPPSVSEFKF